MESRPSFGAAADGDADRNMILGSKFFCTPSDSLAIIVYYAQRAVGMREAAALASQINTEIITVLTFTTY